MKRIFHILIAVAIGVTILPGCAGTAIVAGDNTNTTSAPHSTGSNSMSANADQASATQSTQPTGTVKEIRTNNANKATIE